MTIKVRKDSEMSPTRVFTSDFKIDGGMIIPKGTHVSVEVKEGGVCSLVLFPSASRPLLVHGTPLTEGILSISDLDHGLVINKYTEELDGR